MRVDHPWIDPEQAPLTPEWYARQALQDEQFLTADQQMDLAEEQIVNDEKQYPYRFGS